MYIETVPNRNSPPAILLRESYRDGGKIKKRTIANLSHWPTEIVEGLRTLLKGGTAAPAGQETIVVRRALPHGHVAAVLGTLRDIGLDRLLGPSGNRCRDLVIAMIVARLIAPASKLATARMLDPLTAAFSLGETLGLRSVKRKQATGRTDDGLPVHSFRSLLADLATYCRIPGDHRAQREIPLYPPHQANPDPEPRLRTPRHQPRPYPVTDTRFR